MKKDVVTFEVTPEMLVGAYYLDNQDCPIARALKAKIPGLEDADFGVRWVDIRIGDVVGSSRR